MHHSIDELKRLREPIRPGILRRIAEDLEREVQPQLDELAELKALAATMKPTKKGAGA